MLAISASQMSALESAVFGRFQRGLIPHVREHFPHHADYLGDRGILRVIEQACKRAEALGFETERDLCLFTDLSIIFGAGFDSDSQLPWAKAGLNDALLVEAKRIDVLWDSAMAYLESVLGSEHIFPVRPFFLDRDQRCMVGLNTRREMAKILDHFYIVWPQKAECVGTPALNVLIKNSQQLACHFQLPEVEGGFELALHAFLFGHRFYVDPLYPWANDILGFATVQVAKDRIQRLVSAFDVHFS